MAGGKEQLMHNNAFHSDAPASLRKLAPLGVIRALRSLGAGERGRSLQTLKLDN
jgi:hypothetical protein